MILFNHRTGFLSCFLC